VVLTSRHALASSPQLSPLVFNSIFSTPLTLSRRIITYFTKSPYSLIPCGFGFFAFFFFPSFVGFVYFFHFVYIGYCRTIVKVANKKIVNKIISTQSRNIRTLKNTRLIYLLIQILSPLILKVYHSDIQEKPCISRLFLH